MKKHRSHNLKLTIAFLILLVSPVFQGTGSAENIPTKLFPDEVQSWDYSPSWMTDADGTEKVWWCGDRHGPDIPDDEVDIIRYREKKNGVWGPVEVVMTPNMEGWEGPCVCDPSVVRGSFPYSGQTYKYAMYYTASPICSTDNKIGVAFSHDGRNWVKYHDNPVIETQETDPVRRENQYGAGQAQVYSADGQRNLFLFHTDTLNGKVGQQYLRRTSDGIHFSEPTHIPTGDHFHAAGMAWTFESSTNSWYTIAKPKSNELPWKLLIHRIPAGNLLTGEGWELLTTVPNALDYQFASGFKTNHFGSLSGTAFPRISIAFAAGAQHIVANTTWELYQWSTDISDDGGSDSALLAGNTGKVVTHDWRTINWGESLSSPVVIAGVGSQYGGDTAGLRIKDVTGGGFTAFVEEETSANSETNHIPEEVHYLAMNSGAIREDGGPVIGEAGILAGDQANGDTWHTVNLKQTYSAPPVVLMSMVTFNGGQPAHIRLRNVTAGSFEYQIEEWDYLDQGHTTETMHYIALKPGTHTVNGKKVRAGTAGSVNQSWKTVSYGTTFSAAPAVISQAQTYNDAAAIVTRQKNAGSSRFEVRVQEEEGNNAAHGSETVGFIAVDAAGGGGGSGQSPFGGSAHAIPGKIEAENFDLGGEGVAYHDASSGNSGGAYRTSEDVDIQASGDSGGGYNIGWIRNGEWLEYTVKVAQSGVYTLEARVASPKNGKSLRVEMDGSNVSGSIAVPNTGGWQNFQTVKKTGVSLNAGQHVMRVVMEAGGFNLNHLNFIAGSSSSSGDLIAGNSGKVVTNDWKSIDWGSNISSPVVVAGVGSQYGGDTAGLRIKDLNGSGFTAFIEEEASANSETGHVAEEVHYLAAGDGAIRNDAGTVVGEARRLDDRQSNGSSWSTVNFQQNYSAPPVVLMSMVTFNGGQPAHIRIRNVTATSFQYQIEEWDYLDGGHTTETMHYIAIKPGTHTVNGKKIRAAMVSQVNNNWKSVSYGTSFGSAPAVISQPQTANDAAAIVTRQTSVSTSSFKVRVQEEESGGSHGYETVGFIAVEN